MLLLSPDLLAQTIKFDNQQPTSPAAGRVSATGEYTLQMGQLFREIKLIVVNPKGGKGGEIACQKDEKTWNGQISNLPAATYKVYARLYWRPSGGDKDEVTDTLLVELTVK